MISEENGTCSVTFDGYGTTEIVKVNVCILISHHDWCGLNIAIRAAAKECQRGDNWKEKGGPATDEDQGEQVSDELVTELFVQRDDLTQAEERAAEGVQKEKNAEKAAEAAGEVTSDDSGVYCCIINN